MKGEDAHKAKEESLKVTYKISEAKKNTSSFQARYTASKMHNECTYHQMSTTIKAIDIILIIVVIILPLIENNMNNYNTIIPIICNCIYIYM